MRRLFLALLTLAAATTHANGLKPCADTGESSSRRTITPEYGMTIKVSDVPKQWRDRAEQQWSADFVGADHPTPKGGIHVTGARLLAFPHATFYLLRVQDDQTLFSTKCDWRCASFKWWPASATFTANRDRAPGGVPGDEFYVIEADTPKGKAVLVHSDPFEERYQLEEACLVTLTLPKERDAVVDRTVRPRPVRLPAGMVCADSPTILCLGTLSARATNERGQDVPVTVREARRGSFAPASSMWVKMTDTCARTGTFRVEILSLRSYRVTIRNLLTKTEYMYLPKSETPVHDAIPCE
jgi:hypothetical protein